MVLADSDGWWRGAVIYQIYPRSFQDTDGDGVGDLPGIVRRLGHVADLGADAVWISPFFPSPMKDFGYDVSNYRGVDPLFGTLGDFQDLLAEAHRLGLRVLIDQVLSHTSDRHPWFAESRADRGGARADWYVWADAKEDGTPPNNWQSVFGGPAWQWDTRRGQYYLHNFLAAQPDLNFHNPRVRAAVLEVLKFWLDLGVDGFRLDALNFYFHDAELRDNPPADPALPGEQPGTPYACQEHVYDKTRPELPDFLADMGRLMAAHSGTTTLGEVFAGDAAAEVIAAYTGPGRADMCYGFDFLHGPLDAAYFAERIRRYEAAAGEGWVCWSFSNHDCVRHASRWAPTPVDEEAIARLGVVLLGSLRGSVCIYQGEELGLAEAEIAFEDLQDPFGKEFWPLIAGRDGCRTPMPWEADAINAGFSTARPWLPVGDGHAARAVSAQTSDPASVLAAYRRFLAFRREHSALVRGRIEVLADGPHVLVLRRWTEAESLLCAFNLSPGPGEWPVPAGMALDVLDGPGLAGRLSDGKVVLGPWGGLIAAMV